MSHPPYQQPPYGQSPYGQSAYGQPPYGQPPYGPGGYPYGPPGRGKSPLRVVGIVLATIGGAVVLCVVGCVLFGYFGYRTAVKEQPRVESILDAFMKAMAAKDPQQAGQLLSSQATFSVARLQEMLRESHASLFEKYQSLTIDRFRIQFGTETAVPGFQGVTAEAGGTFQYRDGSQRTFNAVLLKEDEQWKLYSIDIATSASLAPNKVLSGKQTDRDEASYAASEEDKEQFHILLLAFAQALGRKDFAGARALLTQEANSELNDPFRLNLLTRKERLEGLRQIQDIRIESAQVGTLTRKEENQQRKWPLATVRAKVLHKDGRNSDLSAALVQEQGRWRIYRFDYSSPRGSRPQPSESSAGDQGGSGTVPAAGTAAGLPKPPAPSAPEIEHLKYEVHVALHRFLSLLADDPAKAAARLSTAPPSQLAPQQLQQLRQAHLQGFAGLEIRAFSRNKGYSRFLPGFRGESAFARGNVFRRDGVSVRFEALLVRQDRQWRVHRLSFSPSR